MATLNALLEAVSKHLEDGTVEDAEVLCRQALSRAPRSPRVLKTYGLCQIANGDVDGAATTFEAVVEMNPDDADACLNLGLAQQSLRRSEQALLNFERALTIDPENANYHEAIAAALVEKGDTDGALRHLLIANDLKPDDPSTMANLGSVMAQLGAFYDAKTYFEKSLELEPDNQIIAMQFSQILHDLGEHERGREVSEALYFKRPRDPLVLSTYAHSLAQVGELDRALEHVETALKAAPELLVALDAYALVTALKGTPDLGIGRFARLLKTERTNPHLCLSTAAALARDGRHDNAVTVAREALADETARANALMLVRQNLFSLGRFDEALEVLDQNDVGAAKKPAANGGPRAVIIPMETRPLEAILFSRFLGAEGGDGEAQSDIEVFAHQPIIPLLERVAFKGKITPLETAGLADTAARPDAMFVAGYSSTRHIADYKPDLFKPYIMTDPRADDFWRGSLEPLPRPLVGVTWAKHPPEPLLADIGEGLAGWPGTVLSLVWDDQRMELEGNKRIIDAGRHLATMEALVDLIGKLDLVVAPDGLIMHIAGAMGVPGIVLVTPEKPWYWFAEDGRAHWYPSITVLERPWQESMEDFRKRIADAVRDAQAAEAAAALQT